MTQFSIVIPCFNAAGTLADTLDAICAQSCDDWEVLCVDDGSTDKTRAIIASYAFRDTRIRLATNTGKGPSCARNLGALSLACGSIIAFCDADDIWGPEKLAQLEACFTDPSIDAAYGQIAFFQDAPDDARVFSTVVNAPLTIPMLLAENPVCTMSNIAVRSDVFKATGGFNETMVHNEDLDWLIRLVGEGATVTGIDICQTWYRTNAFGLSSDLNAMMAGRDDALRTAARFNHIPRASDNAVYHRYLARRALRLSYGRILPLKHALRGLTLSPLGFFNAPKRGVLTLMGAVCALFFPAALSRALFSR